MTIYGGEETQWGTKKDGFFVSCTKCGWHSEVSIYYQDVIGFKDIVFECNKCGNKHTERITHEG